MEKNDVKNIGSEKMTEEISYSLCVKLEGNRVDKEICLRIPKDEHELISRADHVTLSLVKKVESISEFTLAKHFEKIRDVC